MLDESAGEVAEHFREATQALALAFADQDADSLPPLLAPANWVDSEVHCAAREIVIRLGRIAHASGWSRDLLSDRVAAAIEFLMRSRAGGLGAPEQNWQRGTSSGPAAESVLIAEGVHSDLIARGINPIANSQAEIAYCLNIPRRSRSRLTADDAAHARLRELPDLVSDYLGMRWFRYGPLTAALASALLLKEHVLFQEIVLRKPSGILDGAFGSGDSWSFTASGRGRRPKMLWGLRFAQGLVGRLLTTTLVVSVLLAVESPFVAWAGAMWFLFGSRIKELVVGKITTEQEKNAVLLVAMTAAMRALVAKDHVVVEEYLHALRVASEKGVAFDSQAWQLATDAQRRGPAVWAVRPRQGRIW